MLIMKTQSPKRYVKQKLVQVAFTIGECGTRTCQFFSWKVVNYSYIYFGRNKMWEENQQQRGRSKGTGCIGEGWERAELEIGRDEWRENPPQITG